MLDIFFFFFFQAEDGIRDPLVTGVQTCALPIFAVAGSRRSATFPDLPALKELYPGFEVNAWIGLFTPTGVSAPVLAKLRAETNRLLADPDVREKVRSVGGLEPFISTPEEFAALIRVEHAKYGEAVKAVGVRID